MSDQDIQAPTAEDIAATLGAAFLLAALVCAATKEEERRLERVARFLDLVLEPEDAENAIGNLMEAYKRRRANSKHARWWLRVQVGWIVLNRCIDIVGRVRNAMAGK